MDKQHYTRSYIAYVGRKVLGAGKTPTAAKRAATAAGAQKGAVQTAFASRNMVAAVQAGRRVRFEIARNGRAMMV
jgi:hypothetical protein